MKLFRPRKLGLGQRWFTSSRPTSGENSHCASQRRPPLRGAPLILLVAIISLTGVLGHRFYNEPKLPIGAPAPQTIRAPATAKVEDKLATAEARDIARQRTLSVFMVSQSVTQRVQDNLEQYLREVGDLRQAAGPFPFVDTGVLSTPVQGYVRTLNARTFQDLVRQVERSTTSDRSPARAQQSSLAEQAKVELSLYRNKRQDDATWSQLIRLITQAQQRYQLALRAGSPTLAVLDAKILLEPSDQTWQVAQEELRLALKRILTQGVPPGLPAEVLRQAVAVNLVGLSPSVQAIGTNLLPGVIKANLVIDPTGTLRQRETTAQQVPPVMVSIRQGDIITRSGEPITRANFVLLDHFGLSRRGINWWGLVSTAALVSVAIAVFCLVQARRRTTLSRRDYILILLLSLSAPLIVWMTKLSYTSLPAVGLLVGSFYGSVLGAVVIVCLTALIPLGIKGGYLTLASIAVGSLVGSIFARQPRSREELALLGAVIALTQGITYFVLVSATGGVFYGVLSTAVRQGLIGLGWSIVALGISPYLEHLFDLVTPIRLAELANPNRPLLKRLAQEAPGTFQHTLLVSTLAEAGARALGGNVELVRAGTLYHDIGKMHDPQAFIENQRSNPNKHDDIQDPWHSAEIIKKHVSEGLVMARKCRLPKSIQAFIPEHQGTMVVAYFYYQAQQYAADHPEMGPVQEADFRYPGPIPQSRETGIVMLADSCEAALRSLKDASAEMALNMVNKIFKARWQDHQLVHSHLSREDLDVLANVFVEVWLQFHHKRVPYPSSDRPTPPLPKKL